MGPVMATGSRERSVCLQRADLTRKNFFLLPAFGRETKPKRNFYVPLTRIATPPIKFTGDTKGKPAGNCPQNGLARVLLKAVVIYCRRDAYTISQKYYA